MAPRPVPAVPDVEYPSSKQRPGSSDSRSFIERQHLNSGSAAVLQSAENHLPPPACFSRFLAASVTPAPRSRPTFRRTKTSAGSSRAVRRTSAESVFSWIRMQALNTELLKGRLFPPRDSHPSALSNFSVEIELAAEPFPRRSNPDPVRSLSSKPSLIANSISGIPGPLSSNVA